MSGPGRTPKIEPLGEDVLLLRFGEEADAACNASVHGWARSFVAVRPPWLRDIVPAYTCLALFIDVDAFPSNVDPLAEAERVVRRFVPGDDVAGAGSLVEIPVHYGGVDGPDLQAVADHAGLSVEHVVARHAAAEYTVAMLGFAPGFPYLAGLDAALAMPRLSTPRTRVEAGSVAIGGAQAGIYPRAGPGGWRIIGRTPLLLFDAARDPPSLLGPGDRVRFTVADDRG
jgi:KipI family sensor histidine kinase inhibitor